DPTHFSSGTTIGVDGRLLHQNVLSGTRTETYVMLDLHGADVAPKTVMPVHLSLVIDRSGSMKGGRLESAIKAATLAISRLRDGQANTGVKDVAGFQRIGQAAGKLDVNITTIGVGDDYDSKSLFAIAHESNGQHHYAASDAVLTTIFDGEAKAFASIVATN